MSSHVPTTENKWSGKPYQKHDSYYVGSGGSNSVHSRLLKMAARAGYDDLVHAMVESGLRHGAGSDHVAALQAISEGFGLGGSEDRILAMQKLAAAAGLLDKKRGDLMGFGPVLGAAGGFYSTPEEKNQTVGDRLKGMLDYRRAQDERKAGNA